MITGAVSSRPLESFGADPSAVIGALGQKYSVDIMGATHEPRSAQELSDSLDVPVATSYRRINDLDEVGLLEHVDSVLTEERNRTDVYRREVDAIRIEFGSGSVSVTVDERSGVELALDEAWRSLPD
jgi:hypothetical protein